jgi:co-chaperonin GroES (HSP10)
MEIKTVLGQRIFLKGMTAYKEEKHKDLELIQYKGAIMTAVVAHVGQDCKHHSVGEVVVYQEPIGIEMGFQGVKYLVVQEPDIMFTVK